MSGVIGSASTCEENAITTPKITEIEVTAFMDSSLYPVPLNFGSGSLGHRPILVGKAGSASSYRGVDILRLQSIAVRFGELPCKDLSSIPTHSISGRKISHFVGAEPSRKIKEFTARSENNRRLYH